MGGQKKKGHNQKGHVGHEVFGVVCMTCSVCTNCYGKLTSRDIKASGHQVQSRRYSYWLQRESILKTLTNITCRRCEKKFGDKSRNKRHMQCKYCQAHLYKSKHDDLVKLKCCKCIKNEKEVRRKPPEQKKLEQMAINEAKVKKNRYGENSCRAFHDCCELRDSPGCCHCRDIRDYSHNGLYEGYQDGVGYVNNKLRHANYCPTCKMHCEHRNKQRMILRAIHHDS